MAHQSENCTPLEIGDIELRTLAELADVNSSVPAVWFLVLPFGDSHNQAKICGDFYERLNSLVDHAHEATVICILTTAQTACEMLPALQEKLRYQLWIAVKHDKPINKPATLPGCHSALLILTKYKDCLRHTKTRIAYTYCPECDKTTKDYGGKKHTYHEYGTLMSDVWRDISVSPEHHPHAVLNRLKDVFGLPPYRNLFAIDLRKFVACEQNVPVKAALDVTDMRSMGEKYRNALLNGDCLTLLKEMPSNSVDFCFADPPYNLKKKYDNWNDGLDIHDYFEWCDAWLYELARILKPAGTLAVLNIPLWTARHYAFLKTILNFQHCIVWEGLSLPVRMIMPANYCIICFSKGRPRPLPADAGSELLALKESYCLRSACESYRKRAAVQDRTPITDLWWDIHRLKHNSRRADHPCQLPPVLMMRLLALFTREGESVLDPFNGVGTTTLAAKKLNRTFAGIELSEYYHAIAQHRHKELAEGLDPFRKTVSTPTAKNSPVRRLKKQKYRVTKKTLQLDVKRIAAQLGKLPSRQDVETFGAYPLELYNEYFISWGEVCAAARTTGMSETRDRTVSAKQGQLELFQ